MRDRYEEVKGRGADVVAIGMGFPEMAEDFRTKFKIPFLLLVDQKRDSYKAFGLARGNANQVLGPGVVARGTLSVLKGNIQGLPPKGTDRMQLGGVAAVDKGGEVLFVHRSKTAADNIPIDEVVAALP